MILRKLSIMVIIALCLSIVPITAAASSTVTLNAISSVQSGGTVAISGTSTLNEVMIRVLRPGNSTVYYNIVKVANGQFVDSFTIGSIEPAGIYTLSAGQANQVTSTTFVVGAPITPPVTPPITPPTSLSSNADLSDLTLSSGMLSPAFTSGGISYSASVTYDVPSITVKATASDSHATLKVNGAAVASGQPSSAISLNPGNNLINIVVTAQDGKEKTYTLAVTRAVLISTSTPSGGGAFSNTVTSTDGTLTLQVGKSGEVSLGDVIKIVIPADAFSKDLKLTITKVADTQDLITNKDVLISSVFEILKNFPENFSKEITLTFAFDSGSLKDNQKPSVFFYDETKRMWVEIGGEVNGNTITAKVNHFTKFAVFAVSQGTDTKPTINFSDISGHWAEANIKQAVSLGVVSGYEDGTFKPDRTVTRAEFAVMLMNVLRPQGDGAALTFTDKAKIGTWAQKSVAQAVSAGITTGYEDGSFRPDAEITRPEMAVMIAKATGQSSAAVAATDFADDKDIPDWAKGAVASMKKLGIIEGKGTNQFAPKDKTTRAEAVTVLLKMQAQKSK